MGALEGNELETERLRLRMWDKKDIPEFTWFYSDAANARFVGGRKRADDAWRHLALQLGHWILKGFGSWAVEEKESGKLAGCVGLWRSPEWPETELGYWLMPQSRGKGYIREAGSEAIRYARETVKARSLVSYVDGDNLASKRTAQGLGARFDTMVDLAGCGPHEVFRYF